MRGYVPMSISQTSNLLDAQLAHVPRIFITTVKLADEYGLAELEEIEYAALEKARTEAEVSKLHIIVALDFTEEVANAGVEHEPGVLEGEFTLALASVVAFYLIKGEDEELEWYDASESSLCLEKARG